MMSSMSPHSSLCPGQKPFPFLCQLLELLSCPFLCVIPAVAVLADSHQVGAAPQGEMNIPIINREASRNKYQILRSACPFQPGFTSQPEPAFEEWRGLMAHTKSSRWPVIISAVHYANGTRCLVLACLCITLLIDENLTQTNTWSFWKMYPCCVGESFTSFNQNWDSEIAVDTGIYQEEKATTVGTSGFPWQQAGIVSEGVSIFQALPEQPRFQEAAQSLLSSEMQTWWRSTAMGTNETFPSSTSQQLNERLETRTALFTFKWKDKQLCQLRPRCEHFKITQTPV